MPAILNNFTIIATRNSDPPIKIRVGLHRDIQKLTTLLESNHYHVTLDEEKIKMEKLNTVLDNALANGLSEDEILAAFEKASRR